MKPMGGYLNHHSGRVSRPCHHARRIIRPPLFPTDPVALSPSLPYLWVGRNTESIRGGEKRRVKGEGEGLTGESEHRVGTRNDMMALLFPLRAHFSSCQPYLLLLLNSYLQPRL
ncbi:hypothetical protein MUK42_33860 [Musa troglodytarum]|uniref:Uncharacterized protein n=1 Tax=Musa troglodytarum TaxID=320322 RepID=A0A9E7H924_9LILI|nr:hypothetical protein MUK42_33860 [Musa troglodytarum]